MMPGNRVQRSKQRVLCVTNLVRYCCVSIACLVLIESSPSQALAQVVRTFEFKGLGYSPDDSPTYVTAVSDNGRAVVGQGHHHQAIRWTAATGWQTLLTESFGTLASDVSADGTVVVGISNHDGQAFRWTEATGTAELLGALPEGQGYSTAFGVSRDGRFVAGWSGLAFVYDAQTGQMSGLELSPTGLPEHTAYDIASNGDDYWVAGSTGPYHSIGAWEGAVWHHNDLVRTNGGIFGSGVQTRAITLVEGRPVIVENQPVNIHEHKPSLVVYDETADQWLDTVLSAPDAESEWRTFAWDVSTDGSLVVGWLAEPSVFGTASAIVWDDTGLFWGTPEDIHSGQIFGHRVKDVLLAGLSSQRQMELDFVNWHLTDATGVTTFEENGVLKSIIVGNGTNPDGIHEAWMATIIIAVPEPSTGLLAIVGCVSVWGLRRRFK